MSYPLSLDLHHKQSQKQTQRLMMTPQMQQAIHLLQLPLLELSSVIEQEMEENPVLEYMSEEENEPGFEEEEEDTLPEKEVDFDENQFEILKQLDEEFRDYLNDSGPFSPKRTSEEEKRRSFLESSIQNIPSLADHLMQQAREAFSQEEELKIAEILIGYLDEHGLLKTPLGEISTCFALSQEQLEKVLKVIQTFDPVGVASQNLQGLLLTQLRMQGKQESLAYRIIESYFEDLLHNRIPVIQKALKEAPEAIQSAIQNDIAHLDLHPGTGFEHVDAPTILADVSLRQEGEKLIVDVNEDQLRPLRLNRQYMKMLNDPTLPEESKNFIKAKILSAKWLLKNIHQRNDTLHRIGESLAKRQSAFFLDPKGLLTPLTMKVVAEELELHESTVARAVSNKYIDTPRGIFPFRFFFSSAYIDQKGEDVSSKTVREAISQLIQEENKQKPLSDEAISRKIQELGIRCARRTVAKYRGELKIGNAQQRRRY